ncbi:ankyrin repeat domain-containing protein [Candidatus Lariskella endosymbiont of Epinotia ramella]|uniref:ankyrin repeat domain-containing protein n=1 Tax=Candidatus Lariskella endosymbiont of Epinotia ramella TaxID=3066224 RepID=UPI0030D2FDA4
MKYTEKMKNLRQIYDKAINEVKDSDYSILKQILYDAEFFLRILRQEDGKTLQTFFDIAAKNGEDIKAMIENKGDINVQVATQDISPEVIKLLLQYTEKKEVKMSIQKILQSGCHMTLYYAAQNKNHEVIKLLFEQAQAVGIDMREIFKQHHSIILDAAVSNPNHETLQLLLEYAKDAEINMKKKLESEDYQILRTAIKNQNIEVPNLLLKELAATGGRRVEALLYNKPSLFIAKEEIVMLALSYVEEKDQESFARLCGYILEHNAFEKIVSNNSIKNSIISSSYKISALREKVAGTIFLGSSIDSMWHKDGDLTQISLVKKDMMQYYQGNKCGKLNKHLKSHLLSFLMKPVHEDPDSVGEILTLLRKPLHKALAEQSNKNNIFLEEVALLTECKQGIEPPAPPPIHIRGLREGLLDVDLSTIETSNNSGSIQAVALPMTREERYGFASRYEEEQYTEYAQYITIQSEDVLQALHYISIVFKALDTALNFVRFAHEPTVDNVKKVIIDSAHLYNRPLA